MEEPTLSLGDGSVDCAETDLAAVQGSGDLAQEGIAMLRRYRLGRAHQGGR